MSAVPFCSGLTQLKNPIDINSRKYQTISQYKKRTFCPLLLNVRFSHESLGNCGVTAFCQQLLIEIWMDINSNAGVTKQRMQHRGAVREQRQVLGETQSGLCVHDRAAGETAVSGGEQISV